MNKQLLTELKARFDKIAQTVTDEGVEFWYVRDLMGELNMTAGKTSVRLTSRSNGIRGGFRMTSCFDWTKREA
jgi:hypothetical protein